MADPEKTVTQALSLIDSYIDDVDTDVLKAFAMVGKYVAAMQTERDELRKRAESAEAMSAAKEKTLRSYEADIEEMAGTIAKLRECLSWVEQWFHRGGWDIERDKVHSCLAEEDTDA